MPVASNPSEIHITRIYDAPVKAVWDAWTDPKQVGHWWGPRGFTITTHSVDLRPGGHWNYTMHGPDGVNYPNKTQYLEVEKYAKLVYDHGGNDDKPALFRVTVRFSESNGKTTMDMTMGLPTPEAAEETRKLIRKAGGNSTWDRLAEYLTKESGGKEVFVINRTFDAPIDVMYEMWTNPRHLAQWMGPAGSTMEFLRADVRPGGSGFYVMKMGNVTMYGRANYLEMTRPHRIVYAQQFVDAQEKTSRHPMAPTWPETMLTVVTLTEEGPGRTRVTITWETQNATPEELSTFINARSGMAQGWGGSLDKLEEYLAKQ